MSVKIKEKLAYRRIAEQMYIVDAAASRLHELNSPAALIWEGLAAGKSESRICSAMREEFEVSGEEADADLKSFIGELLKAGLLSDGTTRDK